MITTITNIQAQNFKSAHMQTDCAPIGVLKKKLNKKEEATLLEYFIARTSHKKIDEFKINHPRNLPARIAILPCGSDKKYTIIGDSANAKISKLFNKLYTILGGTKNPIPNTDELSPIGKEIGSRSLRQYDFLDTPTITPIFEIGRKEFLKDVLLPKLKNGEFSLVKSDKNKTVLEANNGELLLVLQKNSSEIGTIDPNNNELIIKKPKDEQKTLKKLYTAVERKIETIKNKEK